MWGIAPLAHRVIVKRLAQGRREVAMKTLSLNHNVSFSAAYHVVCATGICDDPEGYIANLALVREGNQETMMEPYLPERCSA